MTDLTWQQHASCRDHDPELWFDDHHADTARAICRGCDVWRECRAFSLAERIPHGTFGGLGERERRAILRKPPTPDERCGTPAGYSRHRKADEEACEECKAAIAEDNARKRARIPRAKRLVVGTCVDCGREAGIRARKLCDRCYKRHAYHRTLDRYPVRSQPTPPKPARRPAAELAADHDELTAQGYTRAQVAERLGVTYDALDQALRRHRRKASA